MHPAHAYTQHVAHTAASICSGSISGELELVGCGESWPRQFDGFWAAPRKGMHVVVSGRILLADTDANQKASAMSAEGEASIG